MNGLTDRHGDTWVCADGLWWPYCDGPSWEGPPALGQPRPWDEVADEYGPFTAADPARAGLALLAVRREHRR